MVCCREDVKSGAVIALSPPGLVSTCPMIEVHDELGEPFGRVSEGRGS